MESAATTTYDIRVLDLGDIEADTSIVVLGREPGTSVRVPTLGHLLLGGERPVLVDTGVRDPAMLERLGMRGLRSPEQELEHQLGLHDVTIDDVGVVINTHLHLDHCGQDHRFPMSTPVVVNRREIEFAASGLEGPIYAPEEVKHVIDRQNEPGALWPLDLEVTGPVEILPGIRCMSAGGHTEGALMVLVDTAEGVACICGDIVYNVHDQIVEPLGQVTVGEPAPVGYSPLSRRAEVSAIKRALALGATFLLPIHDRPARLERGRVTGRLHDRVPGPVTPVAPQGAASAASASSS
jgi:glyoxylase-like metal-dependent hydrolase (beta-lactamase superfamily II)